MTRRLYILATWIATCMVVLSTMVMHHHHYERVCITMSACHHNNAGGEGTEINAETTHTHHEHDGSTCRVQQLHKFIVSKGATTSAPQHIGNGCMPAVATIYFASALPSANSTHCWHPATPLSSRVAQHITRRGPPCGLLV